MFNGFKLIFLFVFCTISAQQALPFDSLKLREVRDFLADDYGNIYLYKKNDFSFTKYDSLGKQLGKMRLTVPYKVQNVQNPLNIVLFSENAQEVRLIDQNLNEIQTVALHHFGFAKMVFVEDLQQMWVIDDSQKRLVQYNFRDQLMIKSIPFFYEFSEIKDLLVYNQQIYLLADQRFFVFDAKAQLLFEYPVENAKKLRRENDELFIISDHEILKYESPNLVTSVFDGKKAEIVEKNTTTYFELRDNKFYLYPAKND